MDFYHSLYSSPVPFDPKPVKGICTKGDEYLTALSPDNELAYYTRRSTKQEIGMLREETVEEFTFSKLVDGSFDKGKKMPYPFNMRPNEGGQVCQSIIENCFLLFVLMKKGIKTVIFIIRRKIRKLVGFETFEIPH